MHRGCSPFDIGDGRSGTTHPDHHRGLPSELDRRVPRGLPPASRPVRDDEVQPPGEREQHRRGMIGHGGTLDDLGIGDDDGTVADLRESVVLHPPLGTCNQRSRLAACTWSGVRFPTNASASPMRREISAGRTATTLASGTESATPWIVALSSP